MANLYEPQNMKEEASKNMLILETAVNLQAVIDLLVSKGIIANIEIEYTRDKIKSSPKYKTAYEMYQNMINSAELYEKNPGKYLQELLKAKMEGRIK